MLRRSSATRLALILALGLLFPAAGFAAPAAADWPQWRGPQRDGRSPDTGLLGSWPEGGPPTRR
jgi:hypothetical protein